MAEGSGSTPPAGKGQRGGGRRPIDSKTRARVIKLGREGTTRNAIAKLVGISPSTVSRICAEATPPVSFDRSQTAAAVQALVFDAKAARVHLSQQTLSEARRLLELIQSPHEITHWDAKTGWLSRDTINLPTSADVKNYATAVGILLDKHLVLVKADTDDANLSAVDGWLAEMMGE